MADFSIVTEVTGYNVTDEQIERMYARYHFASSFCEDKNVLEVACGSGQGLGYLGKKAKKVIGVDIDKKLLEITKRHYDGRDKIRLMQADAQQLPFKNKSFDIVILYEAIYYLPYPERFIEESYRILTDEGILLICTANKDWCDFNPSPYSTKYFSARELYSLLKQNFSNVKIYVAFPIFDSVKDKVISLIKRIAVKFHLIPKTMKSKEFFKRIFCGKLFPLPPEIKNGMAKYASPIPTSYDLPNYQYKVLFAIGYVNEVVS
ncbi:MAG: class I SAM-dependent methyltransferase [Nitrospirota bacterium]